MCRQGTAAICRKFCLWQNKIVFQRSRTGAYAPPHFYAVNHRQMILVRGCYSIKLNGCQATVAVRHCFAQQNYLMLKRSQPLRSKPHFYAAKSSFDDFRLRLLLRKQKRSQPLRSKPHFYAARSSFDDFRLRLL